MTLEQTARQRDDDLRAILSTQGGRRFLWRLIEPVVASSYTGEALSMSFSEGRRDVARRLMVDAQRVDSALFVLMFSEQVKTAELVALEPKPLEE